MRKTIAVDLRENWPKLLVESGFQRNQTTLWLVEGLLMYLHEQEVKSLFLKMNTLVSTMDTLLFDILTETLLQAPAMEKQLAFLKSLGAPWLFGTNNPEDFVKEFGWLAKAYQPESLLLTVGLFQLYHELSQVFPEVSTSKQLEKLFDLIFGQK